MLIPSEVDGNQSDNSVFVISWLLLNVAAALVVVSSSYFSRVILAWTLFSVSFIFLSGFWSVSVESSSLYGLQLICNIVVAYIMASELGLSKTLLVFGRTIVFLSLAGIVAYFVGFNNVYIIDPHARENLVLDGAIRLRGFFSHNVAGGLFALVGAVISICKFSGRQRWFGVVVCALFIACAGSATGILLSLLALLVMAVLVVVAPRVPVLGCLGLVTAVVLPVGVVAMFSGDRILDLLGRDATLTGRTLIWDWGMDSIGERPIWGWGFQAYFPGGEGAGLLASASRFEGYNLSHFHQSYIQTSIDLGIFGTLFLIIILVVSFLNGYRLQSLGAASDGLVVSTVVAVYAFAGMGMFIFISYNHFATFSLFAILFASLKARGHLRLVDQQDGSRAVARQLGRTSF
ncbi:O-antigen ligase [Nesterenkonia sp. AN1]|uniref:O-antigen ligase family protein n=1 Tax=Nesterenkonia sp. AN1 TaxID=652017 RepID=UPI00137870AD|nr:O-antigen ligase family protein [Nesterenkonia sp. AN1]